MEVSPLLLLAFLSTFHIIGAIALGSAARGIWSVIQEEGGSIGNSVFFIIWGSMFAFVPLVVAVQDPTIPGWVLLAQLLIVVLTFLISAIFGRRALNWFKPIINIHTGLMLLGGIFMAGGLFAGYTIFNGGELLTALIISLVFGLIGLAIFVLGLLGLTKNTLS